MFAVKKGSHAQRNWESLASGSGLDFGMRETCVRILVSLSVNRGQLCNYLEPQLPHLYGRDDII